LIGAKPPLRAKHVWSIRAKLQMVGRVRDLAMFNLAIDSKLRGCDVVNLKVEDVAPHGHAVDRATVRQKKTGQPVRFEMTEQTREAVDNYIRAANKKTGRVSLRRPPRSGPTDNDATICSAGLPMDREHRARSELLRDALTAPNQSNPHLSSNRKLTGGPASAGA
jgi:integrase